MALRETFASRLKQMRNEKNMSFAELGKALGVSSVSLGYYERGERVPDIEVMLNICRFFKVTSDYLIGLTNNRTPENANIGDITGLSDLAITVMKFYKYCYESEDKITLPIRDTLPIINYLLENEAYQYAFWSSDVHDLLGYKNTDENDILDYDFPYEHSEHNDTTNDSIDIISKIRKYFTNPYSDNIIFLSSEGNLLSENDYKNLPHEKRNKMITYELIKQSELIEAAFLLDVNTTIKNAQKEWLSQKNKRGVPNGNNNEEK